ncbi:oxidoreductase, nitrogenase component 1 [Selenomonas sp. oral taxon 137 str. F0430]|uniref:nitrogenase component 1 n=1 Tax=Selenomonas sp. oral taxon 137 TaxID=712531 RepID=UPI0001EB2800|nr:nitrogenase component 1 [Selenomonas sp. oral taxon 137]EFR41731.1 oxidoreductase, nitrogenase component 1 [Selenomonas sp. oral taxon 137 str. F0430]
MATEAKRLIFRRTNCSCAMPGVWRALAYVRGAAVVFHSPRACAHIARTLETGAHYRSMARAAAEERGAVPLFVSGIAEDEAVFGGEELLRRCLDHVVRTAHPEAIFIVSSCVAGVIGDDAERIAEETAEEYGMPVIALKSHGFLDGDYFGGYLETMRLLAENFMTPTEEKKQGRAVLLGDCGGASGEYVREVRRLLAALGVRDVLQFPSYLSLAELKAVPAAEFSVLLGREGDAAHEREVRDFARLLTERFGIVCAGDIYPVGMGETLRWIARIGALTGREEAAEELIAQERTAFDAVLAAGRDALAGKRVVLAVGRAVRYFKPEPLCRLLEELGVVLTGVVILDAYLPDDRAEMERRVREASSAPVIAERDAEPFYAAADFVLTTHELANPRLRQIFLPMLPVAGRRGEELLIDCMRRCAARRREGGVLYA